MVDVLLKARKDKRNISDLLRFVYLPTNKEMN